MTMKKDSVAIADVPAAQAVTAVFGSSLITACAAWIVVKIYVEFAKAAGAVSPENVENL